MCYSAGSISQAVNPCPMCKVFAHQKCPHIRETCRNRTAHPRMDVLYLRNAEVESFKGCGFCKWANQDPPSTRSGYNNPGWPGCCRPPSPEEVEKIPAADWPAVSKVHGIQIPSEVEDILRLILPPLALKPGINIPQSPTGLRSPSRSASRKGNAVAPSKSGAKPITFTSNIRGRQGSVTPDSSNVSRSSSATGISSSLPSSPTIENHNSRRKAPTASVDRHNGEGSSHSSPSRKLADPEYNMTSPPRYSSGRRPALTPATTSVSVSRIVASDTRSFESRLHDPPSPPNRRGSSSNSASNSPSSMTPRSGDSFLAPRTPKADVDCRSNSSGSDGMLSDSTITSEGFTDYLSDESEEELQRQAEARAAVLAQNQMEELEFKMARQQLARVGLEPPKAWTQTNTPAVSPTNMNHPTMSSRNAKISAHSFAVAATAMMQTGQARG